jgi:hypothetical protein
MDFSFRVPHGTTINLNLFSNNVLKNKLKHGSNRIPFSLLRLREVVSTMMDAWV